MPFREKAISVIWLSVIIGIKRGRLRGVLCSANVLPQMQSTCRPSTVVLPRPHRRQHAPAEIKPFPGMGSGSEVDAAAKSKRADGRTLIFTYGTLKQGFSNHVLVQDMIHSGDASYVGVYRTHERYPLVCGPYRVPFLLNLPGKGNQVWGEVYEVSGTAIARMDELEGTSRGHYERLPVVIAGEGGSGGWIGAGEEEDDGIVVRAEAYFAHRSYAGDLWRCNGERGYCVYSEKEARGYVKRNDRPKGLTFLDHIQAFVSSSSVSC